MVGDDDDELLDLKQFANLDDALSQLADSRVYEEVLKAAFDRPHTYGLLTIFAQSACTRLRLLHDPVTGGVCSQAA